MNHARIWQWGLIGTLLLTMVMPVATSAQPATPAADANPVADVSPVALYDALLASSFPDDLLPEGVGPLTTYPWQDSNDRDLAGAIGGVIFAGDDPFRSDLLAAITYVVYPGASGADQMLSRAAEVGEQVEIDVDGDPVAAVVIEDIGGATAVFTMVDNVLVYGMAPHSGEPDVELATELTQAGVAFLHQVAGDVGAGGATPTGAGHAASGSSEDVLVALAATPFPADEVPFEVGELVTLPMAVTDVGQAGNMIGELLVRDAERIYPYPLVFYRVFAGENAALDHVSGQVRGAGGMEGIVDLPAGFEIPYPTTLIDWPNETTTAVVQVGNTVVIGNAPRGTEEERHLTAMTLADIAVRHLADVAPGAVPAE